MREGPHSGSEEIDSLRMTITKHRNLKLLWNGYEVSFYAQEKSQFTALIEVKSGRKHSRMLMINFDSSMNPISMFFTEAKENLEATVLSLEELPEILRDCGKGIAEAFLAYDREGAGEFDGWTR